MRIKKPHMQYIQELKSKSDKIIAILIVESSKKPKLTIVDSPGGFRETKEKAAKENASLILLFVRKILLII